MLLIWLGQLLSQAGTRMYQIALVWWLLGAGGSGREIGLFLVAGALPGLVLANWIGRAVDRFPSRPLLVGFDLGALAVVAAVGWALAADALTVPWLLVSGLLVAACQAVFDPALNKAVGELVEPADLEEAVAFQSSTQNLASFGGALAGAALIDRLGIGGVVALNAASFGLSAVLTARIDFPSRAAPARPSEDAPASGWRVLDGMPWIKRVLVGFGLANFFLTPILAVLPLYAKHTLSGSASLLGLLEASLFFGLVAGTFLAKRCDFLPNKAAMGAACLAVVGGALIVPGLVVAVPVFLVFLCLAGAALGVNNVKFVALFQETVPPEVKGRFFALMQALLSFTFPVAFLLFGLLADRLGPPAVLVVQGLGVLALSAYFARLAGEAA
ncbi:MAG: MFS transporter [Elusimicrobia bacterium]|nr:MFS transporter [Elusimicrobiota bacterium]